MHMLFDFNVFVGYRIENLPGHFLIFPHHQNGRLRWKLMAFVNATCRFKVQETRQITRQYFGIEVRRQAKDWVGIVRQGQRLPLRF